MRAYLSLAVCLTSLSVRAQRVRTDPGVSGPELAIAHLYFDQWPTGVAVSSTGRIFSSFPAGIDGNNTNNGVNGKYAVAELFPNNTQVPYPSVAFNNPPGGAINRTTNPVTSANYQDYLVGVQQVLIDSTDTLWILDTGTAIDPTTMILAPGAGAAKLVSVNLTTNEITRTIAFPQNVSFPNSYLNDVRFDHRANLSCVGDKGAAYLTDSSTTGRNGIVIVDLESGSSWRHLDSDTRTHPSQGFVPFVWGQPLYFQASPGQPEEFIPFGSDGISLSSDGTQLYWTTLGGRSLYSIPTARLRDQGLTSELAAQASVVDHGEKGVNDGMEVDSNGFLYLGNIEQEEIVIYNPSNFTTTSFVRDPRINWVDTMSVTPDGYLYFTSNQFNYLPSLQGGIERRQVPYVLFKVKLANNGTKTPYS